MTEHYWAIRIGRNSKIGKDKGLAYFAVDPPLWTPMLYSKRSDAVAARRKVLSYCGHKDVYVVRVELKESK